jgi:SAM-dependent methyltransferase
MTNGRFYSDVKLSYGSASAVSAAPPKPRILFDACPLCNSQNTQTLRNADCSRHPLYNPVISPTIAWVRCVDCEHVFTDGYFTPEVTDIIFGRTNDAQRPGANFEQQRSVSAGIVQKVARHINGGAIGGPWLDVGFGAGSLLFTAEEWGFAPVGLDLRASSVDAMRRLGIEVHCTDIAAFNYSQAFSVVSMADVLEHMPFPKHGLVAASRLMKRDGVLFVSMPNYNCAAWRLADSAAVNPYWGELEHYHNFSRARLYRLLDEMGFEPVHYGISERYRLCMEVIATKRI